MANGHMFAAQTNLTNKTGGRDMNAPTLLIGLGGTGCKIIERVSKMVTGEQRNNIAFAVFDTDINDCAAFRNATPSSKPFRRLQNKLWASI